MKNFWAWFQNNEKPSNAIKSDENIENEVFDRLSARMPESVTDQLLNDIEDEISDQLKNTEGYLMIGRQTADSIRTIYCACADFRKPSIIMDEFINKYSGKFDSNYEIHKDRYWRSFSQFVNLG